MMDPKARFLDKCRTLHDLQEVQQLCEWDQQVLMPPKGAEQRGNHLALLAGLAHGMLTDREMGDLIAGVASLDDLDEGLRADLREAERAHGRAIRLPISLVKERARACALAQAAWEQARPRNDFASYRPHLERVVELTREVAEAMDPASPYDGLLEDFEPGMTEAALLEIFSRLKPRLRKLLDRILGAPNPPDGSILRRRFPIAAQEEFLRRIIADMGFDMEAGRLDVSAHPFTSGTFGDVRLTTRYDEGFLSKALFGCIHEAGHGLYEQGLDPERFRNPSGQACSLGIHESQSRFWENIVGRSFAFWKHYFPPLRAAFPDALGTASLEDFYRAANAVKPSMIRVEADEVTYNFHIILRFELERDLVLGKLRVGDLPEAWNAKMTEYLGVTPPDDRDGVLQDIHWATGMIGYFPTYTLGNLYGAQFLEALRAEIPDFEGLLERGDLAPIREWLRRNIHVHGRRCLAPELCERLTGRPLSEVPAMSYLEAKFAGVYGF